MVRPAFRKRQDDCDGGSGNSGRLAAEIELALPDRKTMHGLVAGSFVLRNQRLLRVIRANSCPRPLRAEPRAPFRLVAYINRLKGHARASDESGAVARIR
jgi:hypothetical protein